LSITGNGTINDSLTVGNIRTNGLFWAANGYPITSSVGGIPIDFGFVVDTPALNMFLDFGSVT
jgi:hypothetical protein